MTLSIILATRGRPDLMRATVGFTLLNVRRSDTRLVVAVDADDEPSITAARELEPHVTVSVEEREDTLGGKYNRVLKLAPADVYLAMVDYAPHLTPGFDDRILAAAALHADGIGVVYGHWANLSFPQINAATHGLVQAMGYFYPPLFPYWFLDHWLHDIARMLGRIAFADVWIDNRKKAATMELREPGFWGTFYDAARVERHRLAREIVMSAAFRETPERKALLLNNFALHDEHSQLINDACRAQGPAWERETGTAPADERYLRAKANAQRLLRDYVAELEAEAATVEINKCAGERIVKPRADRRHQEVMQ